MLGSYSAPTPMASPGTTTTDQALASAPIPLAPYSYTLLRITGTMQVQKNPYIFGVTPGEGLTSYSAVESRGSTRGGATRVWIRWNGQAYPTTEVAGFLAAEDGRDVTVLVRTQGAAGDIWVGRTGMSSTRMYDGFCMAGHPYCSKDYLERREWYARTIEDFWISQSHTVTGTQIIEPLRIEGPAAVATGTPGTFRAAAFEGLRFRNASGNREAFHWNFYPGDTTATPNPSGTQTLPCGDTIACTFVPLRSGRLRLYTHVEGTSVEARDFIVKVQEPELRLDCGTSIVVRGTGIRCRAAALPASPLSDIRWTFKHNGAVLASYADSAQWSGRIVVGGQIKVAATVGGRARADSVLIGVTPRAWGPLSVSVAVVGQSSLHTPPRSEEDLAKTDIDWPVDFPLEPVLEGPNKGWWFLTSPISPVPVVVAWSDSWNPGSPWYNAQNGGTHPSGGKWCDVADMPTVERLAREHEGLLTGPSPSHISVLQSFFAGFAATSDADSLSPQGKLENYHVYGPETPDVLGFFDTEVRLRAKNDPRQAHYDPTTVLNTGNPGPGLVPSVIWPCYLHFF
ncbi:MAG TPA: hypothetical protein VF665_17655 [Longimicrobium sp.]|uniref:hypothetical protein n=1 Tax=Longimicrobium sp. TaxID=2029185 RepID=UPI002ED8C174